MSCRILFADENNPKNLPEIWPKLEKVDKIKNCQINETASIGNIRWSNAL